MTPIDRILFTSFHMFIIMKNDYYIIDILTLFI